jgi:hypothetical protein
MRAAAFCVGIIVGLAGISATAAVDIKEANGSYLIVNEGEVTGTFWNTKTGESDVKFSAGKGVKPEFFWSEGHEYLAANGGTAENGQVFIYEIGDGTNWTPVAPPNLTDKQLAPLFAIGDDWAATGTEAVRWQQDGTLLLRVWAASRATGDEESKTASIWADLKMDAAKSEVVGTSTEEPMTPEAAAKATAENLQEPAEETEAEETRSEEAEAEPAGPRLEAEKLAGEHTVVGRNADGAEYKGTVTIRVKGGLLLFEWKIGDTTTHGTGLLEDMTVGVGLEDGLAIYQAVPQAEGISLIGLWKTEDGKTTLEETILVGNADSTEAKFEVRKVNGDYVFHRELKDEIVKGAAAISGGDIVKKVDWNLPSHTMYGIGLLLGDGLAVITPEGLAVYAIVADDDGKEYFAGESLNAAGAVVQETLKPIK